MTSLPDTTSLGPVRLTVADLPRTSAFYERVIGLRRLADHGDAVSLGGPDGTVLVELVGRADAAPRGRRSSGLYHLAVLLPSRQELARALRRLALARYPLDGASDHLVSEALYVSDPEGNGIELYRDRPRAAWEHEADGQVRMATLPLDLDDVLRELADGLAARERDDGVPDGTVIGHVHLQVADLAQAEAFYHGVLGFDVVVRGYPGALFVSAGGYHHHLGLNTWASAGGPPNAPGTRGLDRFTVTLPDADAVAQVARRLTDAGAPAEPANGDAGGLHAAIVTRDPFGNALLIGAGG